MPNLLYIDVILIILIARCQCIGQPILNNSSCIYASHGIMTWIEAQAQCQYNYGGSLLEIHSQENKASIQSLWSQIQGSSV